MNDNLFKLSRAAEKAVSLLKDVLRMHLLSADAQSFKDSKAYQDFSYTYPNSNQFETTFRTRWNKVTTELPEKAKQAPTYALVIAAASAAFAAGAAYKAASDEDKARLVAKRAELATRAKQKAELGVDLTKYPKATEATYKALRAAVEPIRASVEEHYIEVLTARHLKLEEIIEKAGSYQKAFPDRRREGWADVPSDFWFFFYGEPNSKFGVVTKDGLAVLISNKARDRSTAEVEAFAAKLTQKIDTDADGATVNRIDIRTCNHRGLWEFSIVDVVLSNMLTQTWYTQIIWNHSCLGKTFNQWPTRRIDK